MSLLYVRERAEAPQQLPQELIDEVREALHNLPPQEGETLSSKVELIISQLSKGKSYQTNNLNLIINQILNQSHYTKKEYKIVLAEIKECIDESQEYLERLRKQYAKKHSARGAP